MWQEQPLLSTTILASQAGSRASLGCESTASSAHLKNSSNMSLLRTHLVEIQPEDCVDFQLDKVGLPEEHFSSHLIWYRDGV